MLAAGMLEFSPESETLQVVVETRSLLATLFAPQDAGAVDDRTVEHWTWHEGYTQNTHTDTHTHQNTSTCMVADAYFCCND